MTGIYRLKCSLNTEKNPPVGFNDRLIMSVMYVCLCKILNKMQKLIIIHSLIFNSLH